jgi:hypothetical protein
VKLARVNGVKVAEQLAVGVTLATRVQGEPEIMPVPVATVKLTVPVGVVAPVVEVSVTAAVQVEP